MNYSRKYTNLIRVFLDNYFPPFIRDSRFFMRLLLNIVFKNKTNIFLDFKNRAHRITEEEYVNIYREIDDVVMKRSTDLNKESFAKVIDETKGKKILEVGCGKALLANELSRKYSVTACDIVIDSSLVKKYPKIIFKKANIECLPFKDSAFDTVICTHTLEHVRNFFLAVSELRRVTKKRLIIVVPKQRPYKYTFDLHLHFFPYPQSLLNTISTSNKRFCKEVYNDLLYVEDIEKF